MLGCRSSKGRQGVKSTSAGSWEECNNYIEYEVRYSAEKDGLVGANIRLR
jgi:hypothetical protein